jgi:hypothetical protein
MKINRILMDCLQIKENCCSPLDKTEFLSLTYKYWDLILSLKRLALLKKKSYKQLTQAIHRTNFTMQCHWKKFCLQTSIFIQLKTKINLKSSHFYKTKNRTLLKQLITSNNFKVLLNFNLRQSILITKIKLWIDRQAFTKRKHILSKEKMMLKNS